MVKKSTLWMVAVLGLAFCTQVLALEARGTGFLGDYSGFTNDTEMGAAASYKNPNKSLAGYDKFIIEEVQVSMVPEAEGQIVNPADMKALTDYFRNRAIEEISKTGRYQIVTEPGPGVLRVRAALTDVKMAKKALNVHPLTKFTGFGTGGAAMEAEGVDSVTGERIIGVVDARMGDKMSLTEGLDTFGHARQAMDQWVARFIERLDRSRAS